MHLTVINSRQLKALCLFFFFVIIGAWETIDLLQEFYDGKFSKYTYVSTVVLVSVFDL